MFNGGLVWGVSWLWYLVGALGVGGTIALVVCAPALAAQLVPAVLRFLVGTRLGVGLAVGVAAFMAADIHRSRLDERVRQAEKAAALQAAEQRDRRIATETRELVWREIADASAQNTVIDQDAKEVKDALPPIAADDACRRVGANRDRLRLLAGQPIRHRPGRSGARPQGVPAAHHRPAGS